MPRGSEWGQGLTGAKALPMAHGPPGAQGLTVVLPWGQGLLGAQGLPWGSGLQYNMI